MVEFDCRRRRLEASVASSETMEPKASEWLFSAEGMISDSCSHRLSLNALCAPPSSLCAALLPCSPAVFVLSVTAMLIPELDCVSHPGIARTSRLRSAAPRIFCAFVVRGADTVGGGGFDLRPGRGNTNFEECPIAGQCRRLQPLRAQLRGSNVAGFMCPSGIRVTTVVSSVIE